MDQRRSLEQQIKSFTLNKEDLFSQPLNPESFLRRDIMRPRVQNLNMEICIRMKMTQRLLTRAKPPNSQSRDKVTDERVQSPTQALTMTHLIHLPQLQHHHQQDHPNQHPITPHKMKIQILRIRIQIFKFKIISKFKIYKKIPQLKTKLFNPPLLETMKPQQTPTTVRLKPRETRQLSWMNLLEATHHWMRN